MNPLVSICIPAYKNTAYLDVLLQSISIQSYRNFEVLISDDSPNDEVKLLCQKYSDSFSLNYTKNIPAKGSPANWNKSISMAKGEWIKLMHDDDWFTDENGLEVFVKAVNENKNAVFIFSGYSLYEDGIFKSIHVISDAIKRYLKKSPYLLFKKNYIGHPSTTLIKNNLAYWYDEKIQWVVDFEFYIRCLKANSFYAIQLPLINIGIGKDQITRQVFRKREIEIPENIYLLNKIGVAVLKNMVVYDYYWRFLRNLSIRNIKDITHHNLAPIPVELERMLRFQVMFPLAFLRVGLFSKLLMAISYLYNLATSK